MVYGASLATLSHRVGACTCTFTYYTCTGCATFERCCAVVCILVFPAFSACCPLSFAMYMWQCLHARACCPPDLFHVHVAVLTCSCLLPPDLTMYMWQCLHARACCPLTFAMYMWLACMYALERSCCSAACKVPHACLAGCVWWFLKTA